MVKNLKVKIDKFFDRVVDLYIYGAIIGLVGYMITTLSLKFYNFLNKTFFETTSVLEKDPISNFQYELLHNIAFTIVLIKAYKILMEYAKNKHINIKYIVEIAIIGSIVEIVFNYSSYSYEMLILFLILGVIMSLIYLFFYEKLKKVEEDYRNEHGK